MTEKTPEHEENIIENLNRTILVNISNGTERRSIRLSHEPLKEVRNLELKPKDMIKVTYGNVEKYDTNFGNTLDELLATIYDRHYNPRVGMLIDPLGVPLKIETTRDQLVWDGYLFQGGAKLSKDGKLSLVKGSWIPIYESTLERGKRYNESNLNEIQVLSPFSFSIDTVRAYQNIRNVNSHYERDVSAWDTKVKGNMITFGPDETVDADEFYRRRNPITDWILNRNHTTGIKFSDSNLNTASVSVVRLMPTKIELMRS